MMVDSGGASLTMTPNIITTSPSGGRFDFDDGGTYCGGWQDGKAHGHGVCTGPKNVGEYSGSWNFGFEMSGVYKWTNGAVYEGRWQNGKRHGVGVEYNGKWIYKGEWSQGLKGRYGVKGSSNSAVKYEGTWANGLQDGYGSETYSDGGYYQGQMCRGLRHGYGVRKSAPYGDSQLNNPGKNGPLTGQTPTSMLIHANSVQSTGSTSDLNQALRSSSSATTEVTVGGVMMVGAEDDSPKPEDGFKPNIDRTLVSKNGFVLVSKPLDVPIGSSMTGVGGGAGSKLSDFLSSSSRARRSSLQKQTLASNRHGQHGQQNSPSSSMSLLRRLRKQKSTSDLDTGGGGGNYSYSAASGSKQSKSGAHHGELNNQHDQDSSSPIIPFTLSPEELDITDPTTVETYMGEWKHDKRNGHGVCERSDGLKYEGQWHNDMKCGYGVTTFKDGSKEDGKYKNNILIVDSKVKRFFHLGGSNIRQRIDDAVKMANQALSMALKKAEIADNRAATARDKADQAMTAAIEADRDSHIAYSTARQYSDYSLMQQQQQQQTMFSQQQFNVVEMYGGNGQQSMMMMGGGIGQPLPFMQTTSLNMGSSPLQMRRISQNIQRQQQQHQNQQDQFQQQKQQQQQQENNDQFGQQNFQTQQQQQQQQILSTPIIEPFNGRRGSFRGGSQPPSGFSYARQSSIRQQHQNQRNMQQRNLQLQQQQQQLQPGYHQSQIVASDPFSDLFDHYKSTPASTSGVNRQRGFLSKQTSLDYAQMRGTSVPPRHYGAGAPQMRQRFRNASSMDQTSPDIMSQENGVNLFDDNRIQQHQLRHLITSGEQLQQEQHQQQQQQQMIATGPTQTPASSINVAPASVVSANTSPHQQQQQQTPSPNTYNNQQQQQQQQSQQNQENIYYNNINNNMSQQQQHRDVHSLADEQLYMADFRRRRARGTETFREPLGRTEFENYDFILTSEPRPTERCRRRTASLTRTSSLTPPVGSVTAKMMAQQQQQQHQKQQQAAGSLAGLTFGSHSVARTFSNSHLLQQQQQQQQQHQPTGTMTNLPSFSLTGTTGDMRHSNSQLTGANHVTSLSPNRAFQNQQEQPTTGCNSLNSSPSGGLSRKPSLQVRYDPIELGGIMSREEVAALSHAQRKQKRFEAEMAEKRAKQPLLHLFMSMKELVERNRLLITVLIINLCLMRMFANLIA